MAHHRLDQPIQARDSFGRAVRWTREAKQLPERYLRELTSGS
jgi:hypothetical protein